MTAVASRPALRGVSHAIAAALALFGAVWLYAIAGSAGEYVSAAIYSTSLLLLLSFSATYHSRSWGASAGRLLRRIDHSMIFLLIAGSYTPFCLLALGTGWGLTILTVVWSLAAAGVFVKVFWIDSPRWIGVLLYLGVGWLAVAAAPATAASLSGPTAAALLAGGVLYTAGAVVYALRRPDPVPAVFGYHEVFHLFVIAGACAHYAAVVSLFIDRPGLG